MLLRLALVALAYLAVVAAAAAQSVTIAVIPNLPAASAFIAVAKGYFRDAGVTVELQTIDDANAALPYLATGRMQIIEGGIAVGYFNALNKGLPIVLALDQGSTPLYHRILLRPDLADTITTIADLRGRAVALVSPGSGQTYEMGKVLATAGLTLKDIDVKYIPFAQLGVAFANRAIDAGMSVPPIGDVIIGKKLALRWIDTDALIEPTPLDAVGYLVNTDWAAKNADLAHRVFTALARAGRDYCQAYHHGPNRAEVMDIMMKNGVLTDRALLDTMGWQARDPNGRVNLASLMDMQNFYVKQGLVEKTQPPDRLVDPSYAEAAAKTLGPFEVINKDDALKGCR